MYEEALAETWALFDTHLSGTYSPLLCVLSIDDLEEGARVALDGAAAALGYGRDACAFVKIQAKSTKLDASALFRLLEGLDPHCIIAADADGATALGATYRSKVVLGAPNRLFGRDTVAFRSFSAMLSDGHEKQIAWDLLKKLPRYRDD